MMAPLYARTTWRLIRSSPSDGATNMATDEAILRAVAAGLVPSTLRLYAWAPPCLSLGRGQPAGEVNTEACARDGVEIVRRPTGGRAILHTDELTYSVIAPLDEPRVEGDILVSYRRLSRALVAALEGLGVVVQSHLREDVDTGAPGDPGEDGALNPVCFEVPSHYELTTGDERKLVGSAQMRTHAAVLQHGTLPLVGDIARICRYLKDPPAMERVRARAATVENALGRVTPWDEAADAMVAGFGLALNLELSPAGLTSQELHWRAELCSEKYAHDGWTWRR
jgi:lipoate-protein ligase A